MSTLQNADVFAVNRGGKTYKVSWQDLKANVPMPHALLYQGSANPTVPPPTPTGGLSAGMVYVLTPAGLIHTGWAGIGGQHASDGQLAIWEGAKWELVGVNGLVIDDASEAKKGIARIATTPEVTAGTDNSAFVTPAKLKAYVDTHHRTLPAASETTAGIIQIATNAESAAGTDNSKAITPLKLKDYVAAHAPAHSSETVSGIVELATAAETTTGTDATRAVHPAGLKVELNKKLNLAGGTMTGNLVVPTINSLTPGMLVFSDANAQGVLISKFELPGGQRFAVCSGKSTILAAVADCVYGVTFKSYPTVTTSLVGSIPSYALAAWLTTVELTHCQAFCMANSTASGGPWAAINPTAGVHNVTLHWTAVGPIA